MTARVIATSNVIPTPRRIRSLTVVSFGPRTLLRAWSTVSPARVAPSMPSMTSPGRSPAFSAGDPVSGATTARKQSSPRVVQAAVAPAPLTVPIVAPMPSNWPEMPSSDDLNSSDVRYCEYGSSSEPIIPLIAPSTSDLRSTSPPA